MSREIQDRLATAIGRRLLRVGALPIEGEAELVFETMPGEDAELLITARLLDPPDVGQIKLESIEAHFGPYGVSERMPLPWADWPADAK
jgi:hypothetical protein